MAETEGEKLPEAWKSSIFRNLLSFFKFMLMLWLISLRLQARLRCQPLSSFERYLSPVCLGAKMQVTGGWGPVTPRRRSQRRRRRRLSTLGFPSASVDPDW